MANNMLKEFTKSKDARNAELYGQKTAAKPSATEDHQAIIVQTSEESSVQNKKTTQPNPPAPYVQSAMRGRPISSSKTARITMAIDPELKERFRVHCAINHQTPSDVVDMLLRKYLTEQEEVSAEN